MKYPLSMTLSALTLSALGSIAQAQAPAKAEPIMAPAATAPVMVAPAVDCCDTHEDCGSWHAYADVGFYILKPHWTRDPALFVGVSSFNPNTGAEGFTANSHDFKDGSQFVPKITLGAAAANGIGARVSWWGFATGGNDSYHTTAGGLDEAFSGVGFIEAFDGGVLTAWSRFRMDVWDLEATKTWEGSAGSLLLSAGLRYAHIAQNYSAVASDNELDPFSTEAVTTGQSFNGIGPTVALEGRLNVTRGLYLYGKTRASVMYGTMQQSAFFVSPFEEEDTEAFISNTHATVPEIEIELGAGFQRNIGRGQVFAEAGIVAMEWFNVGNSGGSNTEFFEDGAFSGEANNLGLFGFSMTFGFRY